MEPHPEYIAARRVLLDALEAIGPQRRSVILVGAQAVYHHCGHGDLGVAPMTTDADLALHRDWLDDEPELSAAMVAAGFAAAQQPGSWRGRGDVCVDLMVVPHQGGRTGKAARAANLPPHRKGIARITRGLEPCLVDHDVWRIEPLEAGDGRSFEIRMAGPSALLAAKLIKLGERIEEAVTSGIRRRVRAKDALDIYRLLRALAGPELVAGLERHRAEPHAAVVSKEAVAILRERGIRKDHELPQLAAEAVGGDPITAASFAVLASELIEALPADHDKVLRPSP